MTDDTLLTLQFLQTQEPSGTVFHHALGDAIEKLREGAETIERLRGEAKGLLQNWIAAEADNAKLRAYIKEMPGHDADNWADYQERLSALEPSK